MIAKRADAWNEKTVDIVTESERTPSVRESREEKTVEAIVEISAPAIPETKEEKEAEIFSETRVPATSVTKDEKPVEVVPETNGSAVPEIKSEKSAEEPSPRIDTPAPFAIRWGMAHKLTWKDTDDIAYALIDLNPDQDPLKLSFPKLHKMITELEDFDDDPEKSSESILEAIQMAWYEEVK